MKFQVDSSSGATDECPLVQAADTPSGHYTYQQTLDAPGTKPTTFGKQHQNAQHVRVCEIL